MTIAYAKEDKEQLLEIIASADRIMIFIISIPIAFLTVFGKTFFGLWVGKTQDPKELYILALLNVGTLFVSASIQVLYHVFLITKKVKVNSMVIVGSGVLTVATVFVLLETTDLGMYAIVGVSMLYGILRNLIFHAALRGSLPEGEMVYLLRRYSDGPGVHRPDLPGGTAL